MLIDTHSHLNFSAFKNDADEVIKRSLEAGVWMINVGSQYQTSKRAVEMAQKYPEGVYAAVGLHPIHLASGIFKTKIDSEELEFKTKEEDFSCQNYRKLAQSPKVVAIGETGLDYYYRPKIPTAKPSRILDEVGTKTKLEQFKKRQRTVLCQQLDLARELYLPVIFHCRLAHDELIEILGKEKNIKGVIHCFTGDLKQAEKYLGMGFYLGFNGIIFKLNLDKIIRKTPLEKILLETDCPYLTPPPIEGRNEPIYVKYVAEKIAELKNINYQELVKITTKNARDLFKI